MYLRRLFSVTMALVVVLSVFSGTAIAQSNTPQSPSQATTYRLTLPLPEVQIPGKTPGSRVMGYYQVALQKAWSQTEASLASLKEAGLVESYSLREDQNAFIVSAFPGAVEQLERLGKLSRLDKAATESQAVSQFQTELQTAIQGAQRPELAPAQVLPQAPASAPPQTYYISLKTEPSEQVRGMTEVGDLLSSLKKDGSVVTFKWQPTRNAFKVTATEDLSYLVGLPGVSKVSTVEPASVQPARTMHTNAGINATTPRILFYVHSNYVSLQSPSNADVVVTLTGADSVVKNINTNFSGWSWNGANYDAYAYFYDANWNSVSIEPGDTLNVAQVDQTAFDYVVPDLLAFVDRDTDTISGTGPANITNTDPATLPYLRVDVNGGVNWDLLPPERQSNFKYVTTDAAGAFSTQADCVPDTCKLDLRGDSYGYLTYADDDGNVANLYFAAPRVTAQLYSNNAWGNVEPFGEVTASLLNSADITKGTFTTSTSSSGSYNDTFHDIYANNTPILPGDRIVLQSSGGISITLDIVGISAVGNVDTDLVTGSAPPDLTATDNINLPALSASGPGGSTFITTDATGKFIGFIAGSLGDLVAGSQLNFSYLNEEADQVNYGFYIPLIFVRGYAYPGYNSDSAVSGDGYIGMVQVNLLRGSNTVATAYQNEPDNSWTVYLKDAYGYPVSIQAGDVIEVIQELVTTQVTVPAFTDVLSDPETDQVTGNTDAVVTTTDLWAPESLVVYPQSYWYWDYGKYVVPDAAGDFVAANPFYYYANPANGDTTLDITPGNQGHLRYINTEGHYILDNFFAPTEDPVVFVRGSFSGYYVGESYVSGYVSGVCSYDVNIFVRSSAGVLKGATYDIYACPYFDEYLDDIYGNPLMIAAGDTVEVSYGTSSTTVSVPAFTDLTSNATTDSVAGNTDALVTSTDPWAPNTLAVWPVSWNDWEYGKFILPDAAGDFLAGNPFYWAADPASGDTTLDIYPGTSGHLRYNDAAGNVVYATFMAPDEYANLSVMVRGYGDEYYGDNFITVVNPNCGDVDVVLKDHLGEQKATTTIWACSTGYDWFEDINGALINILAGDSIEATYNGATTIVEVPEFLVTSDSETDSLSGTTDASVTSTTPGATETLAIWPQSTYDSAWGKHILPDAAGDFVAENPFYYYADPGYGSTNLDIEHGNQGHLRYINADGNLVYDDFTSLYTEPNLWIHKDSNYLRGFWPETGIDLQVSLTRAGNELATRTATTDLSGYFATNLYDADGVPVFILEGDVLTVSDGVITETVDIPHLTGVADAEMDTISGEALPNSALEVSINNRTVTSISDAAGAYTADFLGVTDIKPGDDYQVNYQNSDGHTIFINSYVGPELNALLNTADVWGIGTTYDQEVSVTLLRSGSEIAWDTSNTDWDHQFDAYLYTAGGQPVIIQAGDVISVAFEDGTSLSMTASDLTAKVNPDADLVSGTGPVGDLLHVWVNSSPGFEGSVTPDAAGEWQVDLGALGIDLMPGTEADIVHAQSIFAKTWLYATAPVIYVRGDGDSTDDYIADNYLSGYTSPEVPVQVSVKRDGDLITYWVGTSSYYGWFSIYLYDALDMPVNILGGDVIKVNDVSITVPEIQATLDTDANTVSGLGPPNALLGIYVDWPSWQNQTVTTAADGSFSADFDNIEPDSSAFIRYMTPEGNWIQSRFYVEQTGTTRIEARWNYSEYRPCDSCVSGYAGMRYEPVNLSLLRGGETIANAVDYSEYDSRFFGQFTDSTGAQVAIQPGDEIKMLSGGVTTNMTVATLTAMINKESGVLYGEGPAGSRIYSNWWGWLDVGSDGKYFADFGAENGDDGYIYYADEDGHRTYVGWAYPEIRIRANSNYVEGWVDWNVPVLVELFTSGGKLIASAETTSQIWNGWFGVYFTDSAGEPIIIMPGNTVAVTASPPTNIVVPELTAVVNKASDKVTGVGPADTQIEVRLYNGHFTTYRYPLTDASGAYTADFNDCCDILGGDEVYVQAELPDGNWIWWETYAPMVNVNTTNDIVDGINTPMGDVSLELVRGATTLASTTAAADYWDGFYTAFFTNDAGELIDIKPGDIVQVTASPAEKLTTVPIAAYLDLEKDKVSGTGPANAHLRVQAYSWIMDPDSDWWYDYGILEAETGADGKFMVDFSSIWPLDSTSHVYIEFRDDSGNVSSINTYPANLPAADLVSEWVMEDGATKLAGVYSGVANYDDITPPVLVQGNGDDLYIESYNGALIITTPDGTVIDDGHSYFEADNFEGIWQVQIRKWGYGATGSDYAFAIGITPPYRIFMPILER